MARIRKNYEALLESVAREAGEGYRGATRTQLLLGLAEAQIKVEAVRQKELTNLISLAKMPEYKPYANEINARILELSGIAPMKQE